VEAVGLFEHGIVPDEIIIRLRAVFKNTPLHLLPTACFSFQSLPSSTAGSWAGSVGSLATVSHLYSNK